MSWPGVGGRFGRRVLVRLVAAQRKASGCPTCERIVGLTLRVRSTSVAYGHAYITRSVMATIRSPFQIGW